MRKVAIHFPIVVYPSEYADIGPFTAHCLNLDIIADDETIEGAVSKLLETIEQHLDAAEAHGADPIQMAPESYWTKLRNAKRIPSELMDRIIGSANKRHQLRPLDPAQLEIRELQPA
ncbi:MAG: hypothetical protein AAB341_04625 [Planctomycetota bacterium]